MKSKINIIIASLVLLFAVTQTTHAAFDGLVQCGRNTGSTAETKPCTVASVTQNVIEVVNFLIDSATLLAIAYVFYGGVRMVLARGNPAAVEIAKKTMSSAIIGLIIVLIAYLIISFAITFLTGGKTLDQILNFLPTPTK